MPRLFFFVKFCFFRFPPFRVSNLDELQEAFFSKKRPLSLHSLFLASSCATALERTAKRWKVGLWWKTRENERERGVFSFPSGREEVSAAFSFLSSFASQRGIGLFRALFFSTDGIHCCLKPPLSKFGRK